MIYMRRNVDAIISVSLIALDMSFASSMAYRCSRKYNTRRTKFMCSMEPIEHAKSRLATRDGELCDGMHRLVIGHRDIISLVYVKVVKDGVSR